MALGVLSDLGVSLRFAAAVAAAADDRPDGDYQFLHCVLGELQGVVSAELVPQGAGHKWAEAEPDQCHFWDCPDGAVCGFCVGVLDEAEGQAEEWGGGGCG